MIDKCKKEVYNSYWLGPKEQEILKDSYPWPGVEGLSDCECSVSVGPPHDNPDYHYDWATDLYHRMNKLRIDFVARTGQIHLIAEVTPWVGSGSLGKITLYDHWYSMDKDVPAHRVQPVLLGREHHKSAEQFCKDELIWLADVEEGGPLNWVVRNA